MYFPVSRSALKVSERQTRIPAHVIDKGIPTDGPMAQVMIAKYADHLPLYRQEQIFGRAGLAIPRSTLVSWVGVGSVQLQPLVDAAGKWNRGVVASSVATLLVAQEGMPRS